MELPTMTSFTRHRSIVNGDRSYLGFCLYFLISRVSDRRAGRACEIFFPTLGMAEGCTKPRFNLGTRRACRTRQSATLRGNGRHTRTYISESSQSLGSFLKLAQCRHTRTALHLSFSDRSRENTFNRTCQRRRKKEHF